VIVRRPFERSPHIGSDMTRTYDTPESIARSVARTTQTSAKHSETSNRSKRYVTSTITRNKEKKGKSTTFGNIKQKRIERNIEPKSMPSVIQKSNNIEKSAGSGTSKSITNAQTRSQNVKDAIRYGGSKEKLYVTLPIKSVHETYRQKLMEMAKEETGITPNTKKSNMSKRNENGGRSGRYTKRNGEESKTRTNQNIINGGTSMNLHTSYRQRLMSMAKEATGVGDKTSMPTPLVADSDEVVVRGLPKSVAGSVASAVKRESSGGGSGEARLDVSGIAQGTQPQIGTKTQALLSASKSMKNAKGVKERREVKEQVVKQLSSSEATPSITPKGMPSPHLVTGSGKSEIITTPSGTSSKAGKSGERVRGINMNATVPNGVKERVYKEVKRWLHSLPEWVQDKVDADSLVETIRLASTYGDLMRTVSMINSTVKSVVLSRAKEKALKYMESLPSNVKEILRTTGGIYDEYIKKIKGAKSVEELNKIMEDFVREANDYIKSAYARVMNWQKGREGSILLKWEQYRDFELNKEKVLKWLESLPDQVKNAMGKEYKEVEERVRNATSYKELKEAVKEANEQVREAWLKSKVVLGRSLEMLYPELSRSVIAKFEQYKDFESAKEKVLDYLRSLPEQVKSSLDITKLEQEVRKAKDWKELEETVKDINEQVKGAYRNAVKGEIMHVRAIATTIPSSVRIGHTVSKGTKEVISEKSRKEIRDWINKVGDTLIRAGVWNEFFDKYGKYVKELERTDDPKRARELIEKIREGAEQVLLKHYKSKIISDLEKYKKELKPYERTVIGNTVDEFVSAVKRAKDLDQLRDVVKKYRKELLEDVVIVGSGLKNLEFPNFAEFPTAPQNIGIGEEEATSLASYAMSGADVTNISLNPQEWQTGNIELFKAYHPTSLSDAIMREAARSNNLWDRALGAFLSGFTGATVGMFNPENYYSMYKLITNPKYRSEYFKEMDQLRVKHPELFWGSIAGTAVGMGLMAGLGRVAGGKELAVQEFEPILQIRRGNLAKGSITEIGYWKTLAKLPKDEVLEFGKGGMFMKGAEGGFSIESFKTPTMEEVRFGVKGIELPKEAWSSSVNLGKVGSVEMKWILPKIGEPIATEIKGFEISSTPETVKFSAIEAGKPTGMLGKTLGGKVFRYAEVEGEVPYDFYRSLEMSGWKFGKLGITRAKWGEFEGKLPTFKVEFGGGKGFKGFEVRTPEVGTGSKTPTTFEEEGIEIPIEGGEETTGTETPEVNVPIQLGTEETGAVRAELGEVERGIGEGAGKEIEARGGKGQAVKLVEKTEGAGKAREAGAFRMPMMRIVEEGPSWVSSVELGAPASMAGIGSLGTNTSELNEMLVIPKDITKLVRGLRLSNIGGIIVEEERVRKGMKGLEKLPMPTFRMGKGITTTGTSKEGAGMGMKLVEPITYRFMLPPTIVPRGLMFERIRMGNMMSPVPMERGKTVKVPFEVPQTPKVEGFRYEPRFKYVTPSIETSPATVSLNTPSVSTLDTASQVESTITPPPEGTGEGISDINIQGVIPVTPPPPNTTPPPNNRPNPPQIAINPPTAWSPKWRLPMWWYPLWWRRRYAKRPRYVLEVLTL